MQYHYIAIPRAEVTRANGPPFQRLPVTCTSEAWEGFGSISPVEAAGRK